MEKVTDPADPNRCQGITHHGQCSYRALPGQKTCERHGGRLEVAEQYEANLYRLNKARWRHRMAELRDHEQVKSLRDEIALCRILIEERYNSIKDDTDMLAASSSINSLFLTLERLVRTTHTIEQNLGNLLTKATVIMLGQAIVQILTEELQHVQNYESIVDRTCDRLYDAIESARNPEEDHK